MGLESPWARSSGRASDVGPAGLLAVGLPVAGTCFPGHGHAALSKKAPTLWPTGLCAAAGHTRQQHLVPPHAAAGFPADARSGAASYDRLFAGPNVLPHAAGGLLAPGY